MRKSHGAYCNHKTTRLCRVWQNMKQRTSNPNNDSYKNYGGRGITICDEWNSFISFKEWALSHGYKEDLTIERIDNNKGYSPGNCCFMPIQLNNLNRRRSDSYGIYGYKNGRGIYYKVFIRFNNKAYYNKGSMDYSIALKLRNELLEMIEPLVREMKQKYLDFKKDNLLA